MVLKIESNHSKKKTESNQPVQLKIEYQFGLVKTLKIKIKISRTKTKNGSLTVWVF